MNRIQFKLCLPVIASTIFGFYAAKLDAQDSAGPNLIAPSDGALLDNGRTDRLDVKRWEFEWAPVPNADKYRLKVQGKSAKFPAVNRVLVDTRFAEESKSHIISPNQQGWTWKVQARVNAKWGNWSEERTFDVEPLDTDLATTEDPTDQDIRGTSTAEILALHQKQNEINFDESLLVHEPVASYPRYQPGSDSQEHLRFSADGKYIAIGGMTPSKPIGNGLMSFSSGGRIELWNVESGKQVVLSDNIKTHIHPTVFPVAFSRDTRFLAAADTNGQVKIWDLSTEKLSEPKVIKFNDKDQNSGIASALSFTPDSKRVLVGAHPTHQLEIESGKEINLCEHYSSSLLDPDVIELSPDGSTIAFGGLDKGVKFLDRNSGKFSDAFKQQSLFKQIDFYQFLPSGTLSVVAGRPVFGVNAVVINDNTIGTITAAISFAGQFRNVAVSLDGSTLAVADAKIKKSEAYLEWQKDYENAYIPTLVSLWRVNGGKLDYLGQINAGNKETVTTIGLSPDGMTLVTSGANLRFWDVKAFQTDPPEKAFEAMGVEKPTAPRQAPVDTTPIQFPNDNKKGLTLQEITFLENEGWKIDMTWGLQISVPVPTNTVDDQKLERLCKTIRNYNANYVLNLGNTRVSDDGLKHLPLKSCYHLDLSGTLITNKAGESLGKHDHLNSLVLSNTAVDGEILAKLSSELRVLKLAGTAISDQELVNLKRFKKLQTLDVSSTSFGDEGIKLLLDLPELRSLSLGHTEISEKGLKLIKGMPHAIEISVTSRRNDRNSKFSDEVLSQSLPNFFPVLLDIEQRVQLEPIAEFATGAKVWPQLRETAVSNDGKWAVLRFFDINLIPIQQKLVNLQSGKVTTIDTREANRSQPHLFPTGRTVVFSPDAKTMIAVFDNKLSSWNLETDGTGPPVTIAEVDWPCSINVDFKTGKIDLNQPGSIRTYDLSTLKLIKNREMDSNENDLQVIRNDDWSVKGSWLPEGYKLINNVSGEATELFPNSRDHFMQNRGFRSSNVVLNSNLTFRFSGDGQWLFSVGSVKYPRDYFNENSTRVMIHSLKERSMIAQIDLGQSFYNALPLSLGQNSDRFATLNHDRIGSFPMVAIWQMTDSFPELIGQFSSGHQADFLHFAQEDNKVISIGRAQIRVWDITPILK